MPDSSNLEEIKRLLVQVGCSVADISSLGTGLPLLLVGADGLNLILQHGGPLELDWEGPIYVVETKMEALDRVNQYRRAAMNAGIASR